MNSICKVKNCRFYESHVTCRHLCGKCHNYGHGMLECNDIYQIDQLKKFNDDRFIENICEENNCIDRTTHTTSGHSCLYCYTRNLDNNNNYIHLKKCPMNGTIVCDMLDDIDIDNILSNSMKQCTLNKGQYYQKYAGMGCMWFIRCNIDSGLMEYLFMHSDCWGQYGEDSSNLPRYNAFIHGYIDFILFNINTFENLKSYK